MFPWGPEEAQKAGPRSRSKSLFSGEEEEAHGFRVQQLTSGLLVPSLRAWLPQWGGESLFFPWARTPDKGLFRLTFLSGLLLSFVKTGWLSRLTV